MEELGESNNMSVSSLHHKFKEVTTMGTITISERASSS